LCLILWNRITIGGRTKLQENSRNVPGPGNYNLQGTNEKKGTVFSHGSRRESEAKDLTKLPGPGAYNASDMYAKLMSGPKYG
jgi:hypothetical protein